MKAPQEMFHGFLGELVGLYEAHTEACPEAIASQFLVAFGSAVGPSPRFYVGETRHRMNEFLCLAGITSRGRKGDAERAAMAPIRAADEVFAENCIAHGLSSGEGLIHAVRDPIFKVRDGERTLVDEGVTDKRLLAIEGEFASALKQFRREGNTLSPVLRTAWDGVHPLRTLTKNAPEVATGAHISLISHCTQDELRRLLTDVEIANGLGNRFLFIRAERARLIPCPPRLEMTSERRLPSRSCSDLVRRGRSLRCNARRRRRRSGSRRTLTSPASGRESSGA